MTRSSQVPSIAPPVKVLLMIFDARDEWEGGPLDEALVRVLESTASRARRCCQASWDMAPIAVCIERD